MLQPTGDPHLCGGGVGVFGRTLCMTLRVSLSLM